MSTSLRRLAAVVLLGVLFGGCAARGRAREYQARLAQADILAAAGCYRCLTSAFATYETLLEANFQREEVLPRAYDTALLLAAREKELGLPAAPWIDRARELPIDGLKGEEARLLIEVADGLPWNRDRFGPEGGRAQAERTRESRMHAPEWYAALSTLLTSSRVSAYLLAAVTCEYRSDIPAAKEFDPTSLFHAYPEQPLLLYRVGTCERRYQRHLERALDIEPRFVEANYFLGIYELGSNRRDAVWRAIEPLRAAHEGIPESPAVAVQLADTYLAASRFAPALGSFAHTLKLMPEHRDALLGKTMTESYLKRHDEAIATATRLIDLGAFHIGEAYYWRAWNKYHQQQLDAAHVDIEDAKKRWYHTDVFTLAGIIAYDQKELEEARRDLEVAVELDVGNCQAMWYSGLAHAGLERWPEGGNLFAEARACAERAERELRNTLALIENAEMAPDLKARQIAAQQESIEESRQMQGTAAYNAAWCYVNVMDAARARPQLDRALQDPTMKAKAEELLAFLNEQAGR
jgi:tetratricopeptide (TPR) repeat protein